MLVMLVLVLLHVVVVVAAVAIIMLQVSPCPTPSDVNCAPALASFSGVTRKRMPMRTCPSCTTPAARLRAQRAGRN